jgi:hypothetical protein
MAAKTFRLDELGFRIIGQEILDIRPGQARHIRAGRKFEVCIASLRYILFRAF